MQNRFTQRLPRASFVSEKAVTISSHQARAAFFGLKGLRRTSKPERWDDCGFRDIVLTNQYLVTAPDQVRLREHHLSGQPGRRILDMRDWTRVWDGGAVETAVVGTRPVACLNWEIGRAHV